MRLLIGVLLSVLWAEVAIAQNQPRHISVTGHGKIAVVPDMARVSIGVEITSRKAGDALRENSDRIFALMDVLDQAGVEKRDIRTTQLNLHPRWEQRNTSGAAPSIIGYTAQNILQVRIRKIDQLGEVLNEVTKSGANRINQISFSVADPAPLLKEARLRAIADARAKAELYANAAGAVLGEVLTITEGQSGARSVAHATSRMESAMAVPVAEGEVSHSAQIQVTYSLK